MKGEIILMKKMNRQSIRLTLTALLIIIESLAIAQAQDKTISTIQTTTISPKTNQPMPLPTDLAAFFSGEWEGTGQFSNGKEIKADVKFSAELDSQWLLYSHQDRSPNKYKALGVWGFERNSGKFMMIVQDNFGSARSFESDSGWKDGKVIFINKVTTSTITYLERFTFERQSEKSFKMSYETNKDANGWRLGDYLIFTRKR